MYRKITATAFLSFIFTSTFAQNVDNIISADNNSFGLFLFAMIVIVPLLFIIGKLYFDFKQQLKENNEWKKEDNSIKFSQYLKNLDRSQLQAFIKLKSTKCCGTCKGDGGCNGTKKNN